MNTDVQKKQRRAVRVRKSIASKNARPRLSVHRSNRYITAQIIDDTKQHTVAAVSSKTQKGANYTERATAAGKTIAELAKKAGIDKVVFDRGSYIYTGRVKALAEGAREGGLQF